jgi:putative CocE/NonD family hydrolase
MKKIYLLLVFLFVGALLFNTTIAQSTTTMNAGAVANSKYAKDVSSVDNIIAALYNVICGAPGEPRDWERFKYLFGKDAKLIPTGKIEGGNFIYRTMMPPAKDIPDAFTYDPMNPVTSYGGNVCCTGNAVQGGSFDQSQMELRNDILVYTSEELKEGVEVTGFIESTLYVSSTGLDTDVTIKLIDVHPDGKAYNLDETIQRLRYREGYDKEVFMEKGKVYKVNLTPMVTSNFFAPGHKIRIEVSSSNFPRFERNLNTGGKNYDEATGVVVENKIHHSKQYPSVIKLPIIKK